MLHLLFNIRFLPHKTNLLKKVLVLLFIFIPVSSYGGDFKEVIKHVNNVPKELSHSINKLSHYLAEPFLDEEDKFASIYYWIALNIEYNDTMSQKPLFYNDRKELVDYTIKNHDGICQHFAELFVAMCKEVELEAHVVGGYINLEEEEKPLSHTWNIIKLEEGWFFVDATWGGSEIEALEKGNFPDKQFLVTPQENILIKMPYDPIWQALPSPVSYNDFDNGVIKLVDGNYNFNDSIKSYISASDIEKFRKKADRMIRNGHFNKVVGIEYQLTKNNQKALFENIQIKYFNEVANFFNMGLLSYNKYIKFKNEKNSTLKQDREIMLRQLNIVLQYFSKAKENMVFIEPINQKMRTLIVGMQNKISELENYLKKDKELLIKYSNLT